MRLKNGSVIKTIIIAIPTHKELALCIKQLLSPIYTNIKILSTESIGSYLSRIHTSTEILFILDTVLQSVDHHLTGIEWAIYKLRAIKGILSPILFLHFRPYSCLKAKNIYSVVHQPGHSILVAPFTLYKFLKHLTSLSPITKKQLIEINARYAWRIELEKLVEKLSHMQTNVYPQLLDMISTRKGIDPNSTLYKKFNTKIKELVIHHTKYIKNREVVDILNAGRQLVEELGNAVIKGMIELQEQALQKLYDWIERLKDISTEYHE